MTLDYGKIKQALENNDQLVLFLDYDGTLADFSKRPDIVKPNPEVIELLNALVECESITPAIISGRRLPHIQKLIPIQNILLAGTYGLEIQLPGGKIVDRQDFSKIRPYLEKLKPQWQRIMDDKSSLFLEDKGWTLAIHARYAEDQIADAILTAAEKTAKNTLPGSVFQVNPGHKFLEASPRGANKGDCVKYLMDIIPIENKTLIYMGDDDKDEEAFEVVQSHGGFAIRVCSNVINKPIEDWRLENPKAARNWLWEIVYRFS
jgi:trehalose 6-phosphate phosphatase